MYYDLITSFPRLPDLERSELLPITPRRLNQRLQLLKPHHQQQLSRCRGLFPWRPEQLLINDELSIIRNFRNVLATELDSVLRGYLLFRAEQQIVVAAHRKKLIGDSAETVRWGLHSVERVIIRNWEQPELGLQYLHAWARELPELLRQGNARALEGLIMRQAWRWLSRQADESMFGFRGIIAYVLRWDILRAWIAGNAAQAQLRFSNQIDKVTDASIQ